MMEPVERTGHREKGGHHRHRLFPQPMIYLRHGQRGGGDTPIEQMFYSLPSLP